MRFRKRSALITLCIAILLITSGCERGESGSEHAEKRIGGPVSSGAASTTKDNDASRGAVAPLTEGSDDRIAVQRPNILLIVGDDIGFGDLGAFGSITNTPNLDRLVERGTTFTSFHASPVCSVSRAMLLTGNNPIEVGLGAFDYTLYPPAKGKPGYEAYLTRTTATIAELLQDAGYFTCMVGKWHLGGTDEGGYGPHEWGFERSYGIYGGASNHWNQGIFQPNLRDPKAAERMPDGKPIAEPFHENGSSVVRPVGIYSDNLYTSKLLEYLQEGQASEKPFFAYVAYTTAHAPIQAPDFLITKYYEHYRQLGYEGLKRARFESQKKHGILPAEAELPEYDANPLVRAWSALSDDEKRREALTLATYSAMMESQDYHIGIVLNFLQETGELDNTLIIYMSDNGPEGLSTTGEISNANWVKWIRSNFSQDDSHIGRGDAFGFIGTDWASAATGGLQWWKWFIGEGGIRTPLIVVPPANTKFSRPGEKANAFASVLDVPMTILDYAGVDHPRTAFGDRAIVPPSGVSVRKFLEGNRDRPRSDDQWVAFELFGNSYVIAGDYKAIRVRTGMYGDGKWHLYDIKKDPGETRPLEAEEAGKLEELIAIYEQYANDQSLVPVAENWNPWHGFIETKAR